MKSRTELGPGDVVFRAKAFEEAGANVIFLITTADYPYDRYL